MTTHLETCRQGITTAIESVKATFTAYPLVIEYDNRIIVDTQTQSNPYLCVNIRFVDGWQGDLNPNPFHRLIGFVEMIAHVKEGAGVAKANELLEFFYPKIHRQKLGGAMLEMAKPAKVDKVQGWRSQAVLIPFWMSVTY